MTNKRLYLFRCFGLMLLHKPIIQVRFCLMYYIFARRIKHQFVYVKCEANTDLSHVQSVNIYFIFSQFFKMNKTLVLVVCLISNVILTCEARIRIGPNLSYSKPVKRSWSSVMQNYTIVRPLDEGKGTEHVF